MLERFLRPTALIGFLYCVYGITQRVLYNSEICSLEGCTLVKQNIRIDDIWFNIVGALTFLLICLVSHDKKFREPLQALSYCIVAAEGVLLSFQLYTIEMFCSSCLVVAFLFGVVTVCLLGKKVWIGAMILGSVLVISTLMKYPTLSADVSDSRLTDTITERVVVISSTCSHCAELIEKLEEKNALDKVMIVSVDSADGDANSAKGRLYQNADWSNWNNSGVNTLLEVMNITAVPVMIDRTDGAQRVLVGTDAILADILPEEKPAKASLSLSPQSSAFDLSAFSKPEACGIQPDEDCADPVL